MAYCFWYFKLNSVVIAAMFFAALRMTIGESNVPYWVGTKSMTEKMGCEPQMRYRTGFSMAYRMSLDYKGVTFNKSIKLHY